MRVLFLMCLIVFVTSSYPCQGATIPENAAAPSAGTTPLPPNATTIIEAGVVCPTGNEAARRQYNKGLELRRLGKLREAQDAYLKAVELDPGYCDAMDNLGQLLRREGDVKQAISWYRRSLSVKPDNAVAHQDLAVAYVFEGDTNRALSEYQWLVANDPENPEGYYGLGKTCLESGRTKDAVEALTRAVERYRRNASPLLADAYYLLGWAYFTQNEYQKAKEYLELSYPGREEDPNINYLLGLCFLDPSNVNRTKAAQYLRKAQALGMKIPPEVRQTVGW